MEERALLVAAESLHGAFTLLPRHADTALLITPGLLSFTREDGAEVFLAVDHGVLVKAGDSVRVACQRAVLAGDLGAAESAVRAQQAAQGDSERRARTAVARLEAEILRKVAELGP